MRNLGGKISANRIYNFLERKERCELENSMDFLKIYVSFFETEGHLIN